MGNGADSGRKVFKFERPVPGEAPKTLTEEEQLAARRQQDLSTFKEPAGIHRVDHRDGPYYARMILDRYLSDPAASSQKELASVRALHPIQLAAILQMRTRQHEAGNDVLFDVAVASAYFRNLNSYVDHVLMSRRGQTPFRRMTDEYAGRSDASLETEFLETIKMQRISPTNAERALVLASLLHAVRGKQPRPER